MSELQDGFSQKQGVVDWIVNWIAVASFESRGARLSHKVEYTDGALRVLH